MKKPALHLFALILAFSFLASAQAQDLAGDWQGTVKMDKPSRVVLHMERSEGSTWKITMYFIDDLTTGLPIGSVALEAGGIKFTVPAIGGSYEGKLGNDTNTITGIWKQGESAPLNFQRATKETTWPRDPTHHKIALIPVEKDIKLEVLDFGGNGKPLVFLTGLGNDAHIFDQFAPKFVPKYHVYAISRRGFGASSKPALTPENYSADRLADDVLTVLDALKLVRPVLVGHSIGGEELSSIGSRHPEKVAGLIYLDAIYSYALYDEKNGDVMMEAVALRKKLDMILPTISMDIQKGTSEILAMLPQFQKDLEEQQNEIAGMPNPQQAPPDMMNLVGAIIMGQQKYTTVHAPVLALYATPGPMAPISKDPAAAAASLAARTRKQNTQIEAFEAAIPSAHVVMIPNANHYLFLTNESATIREMNAFLDTLK